MTHMTFALSHEECEQLKEYLTSDLETAADLPDMFEPDQIAKTKDILSRLRPGPISLSLADFEFMDDALGGMEECARDIWRERIVHPDDLRWCANARAMVFNLRAAATEVGFYKDKP